LGSVFTAPLDVHLPSGDIVEPDVLFISNSNAGIIQDWVRGAPDLVVEVLSPEGRERDRIIKRDLYARNRIKEYWIVDPEERSFEVFTLHGAEYEPEGFFEGADVLVSPLFPNFKLRIAGFFADE
jgi:Uma2 family endonuclease